MSDWQKVENAVQQSHKPADKTTPQPPSEPDESMISAESERASSARYSKSGYRKGMRKLAAPLGLIIMLFAMIGVASLVWMGIQTVKRTQDDTALKVELYDFLLPVMQYNPQAFTDISKEKQDALLLAAIWRITEAERIRQLKDSNGISKYPLDDMGRMQIPVSEIEDSYMKLFGLNVVIYHHSIGEEGKSFTVEYDSANNYYHVPTNSSSMYDFVIDKIKKKGNQLTVRVGYVLQTKIGRDEKGELVDPTVDLADKFQIFTVTRDGNNGWNLVSIADENPTGNSTETQGSIATAQPPSVESQS